MLPLELLVFRRLRRHIIPYLAGRILEIGGGTGVNIPIYQRDAQVTFLDSNGGSLQAATGRLRNANIAYIQADARELPFGDNKFDHAVATLAFCSLDEPEIALKEIERVLAHHGWLTLIEHVRGDSRLVRYLTAALAPAWYHLSQSCRLDRETVKLVSSSGLRLIATSSYLGGLVQVIVARKPK